MMTFDDVQAAEAVPETPEEAVPEGDSAAELGDAPTAPVEEVEVTDEVEAEIDEEAV